MPRNCSKWKVFYENLIEESQFKSKQKYITPSTTPLLHPGAYKKNWLIQILTQKGKEGEGENYWEYSLGYTFIFFIWLTLFVSLFKKSLLTPSYKDILSIKTYKVLPFTFISIVQLIFVYNIRSRFILFYINFQLTHCHLLKRPSFPLLYRKVIFVINLLFPLLGG